MTSSFMILALAGSALAVPFNGENAHWRHRQLNHYLPSGHHHHHTGTGAPYGLANATGIYGATGTAASTGFPVSVASDYASLTTQAAAVLSSTSTSTTCLRSTVYVTTTNSITLTVQRNGTATATTSSADSEETEDAAADETDEDDAEDSATVTLNVRNKAYEGKQRWRQTSTAASSAQVVSTAAATSPASVYVAASSSSAVVSSKTSSSAAASSTASSGSGKRGVAYNDATLTTPFESAKEVTWGYNWGQASSGLSTSFNFVPLLWGTSSTFTNGWAASVKAAATNGNTHLMAFNEPDLSTQSNLSPEAAAAAYKTYMQPYAGQFKLGAPAVTNGGGAMGLNWLDAFLKACDGCTIDFVSVHWYDSAAHTDYFKEHISNATTVAGGRPVWVTEFGCTSGSDSDISTFLQSVMPWMDAQSYVERYSYFMVADGGLVSGGQPSGYGSTYMSYTS